MTDVKPHCVDIQEKDRMTQSLQRKQGCFVDQMANDARAVAQAFDGWIDSQERNIRVELVVGVLATVVAHVERPETHEIARGVTVRPDPTVAKLNSLWDVVAEQPSDKGIIVRPTRDCLKLGAFEADQHRSKRDRHAVGHAWLRHHDETMNRVGGGVTAPVLPHHRTYSTYPAVSVLVDTGRK
ncbi:MAG: hypothetical protein L0Y71_07815, partial [Gemmataceae bacterium]|nr:hypothetical protein [Gemmataceae bacterium]